MEVIPSRVLNLLYIYLDIGFLLILLVILLVCKKYLATIFGICGGLLYFVVDYGGFYWLLGTRQVVGVDPFWFLLWLSMSYGFTNFVWIWLWLDRDKRSLEWSVLIISGWLAVALLSQNFGQGFQEISISRGTSSYHGIMALVLFVGYAVLCIHNLRCQPEKRYPLLWILAIGVLVQFAWELVLLITGIRAQGLGPLFINSLLETNLGLPYIFFIHRAINRRYGEDLKLITLPQNSLAI